MRKASARAVRKYEARQIARIRKWRARRPGWVARSTETLTRPIVWVFHRIIPVAAIEATLHGNMWLARQGAHERGMLRALGVASLAELGDADLLVSDRVARKYHRRAIYVAGSIGFVSGLFGFLALPVGMAGAISIALRTIHKIGLSYGYAAPHETEHLFAYYTLSLAGNRAPAEKAVSLQALRELQALIATADRPDDAETTLHLHAMHLAHHDFSREITKQLVQMRLLTAIPVVGAGIGVIVDANYMRSVGWAARHAYQLRWLRDRGRWPEDGEGAKIEPSPACGGGLGGGVAPR